MIYSSNGWSSSKRQYCFGLRDDRAEVDRALLININL
jgi:hypothetical protein